MERAEQPPSDDWLRKKAAKVFSKARPKRLGVAVSGGGDSMACLDLMLWYGAEQGVPVEAQN